jgi:hypothetical protein
LSLRGPQGPKTLLHTSLNAGPNSPSKARTTSLLIFLGQHIFLFTYFFKKVAKYNFLFYVAIFKNWLHNFDTTKFLISRCVCEGKYPLRNGTEYYFILFLKNWELQVSPM